MIVRSLPSEAEISRNEKYMGSYSLNCLVGSAHLPPGTSSNQLLTYILGSKHDSYQKNYVSVQVLAPVTEDSTSKELQFQEIASKGHPGAVSSIEMISPISEASQLVVTGSESGHLNIYGVCANEDGAAIERQAGLDQVWESPITDLAVNSRAGALAAVSDAGGLSVYLMDRSNPVVVEAFADSVSLSAVSFRTENTQQVITAGSSPTSQLKLWDLKVPGLSGTAERALSISLDDGSCLCSLALHPTKPELVAAGSEQGDVCLFDFRYTQGPVTAWRAHSQPVTGLQFHPRQSDYLFSTAEGDGLIQWDFSPQKMESQVAPGRPSFQALGNSDLGGSTVAYSDSMNMISVVSKLGQVHLFSGPDGI